MMCADPSDLPLVLDGVSLAASGTAILERIDLAFTPGTPTLILGPNGSGKTSLLRICMGLAAPTAGTVSWGGRTQAPQTRRAILFQKPMMLRRSAAANVRYGLAQAGCPRALRARCTEELLERVGLLPLASRPARRLSGGEQQRLALARALARQPEILFLDEPTASLDFGNQALVLREVRRLVGKGFGLVISTHNPDHAFACATRVALLHDGGVMAAGAPADALTPDHMLRMYGVTVTIERLADGRTVCAPALGGM